MHLKGSKLGSLYVSRVKVRIHTKRQAVVVRAERSAVLSSETLLKHVHDNLAPPRYGRACANGFLKRNLNSQIAARNVDIELYRKRCCTSGLWRSS